MEIFEFEQIEIIKNTIAEGISDNNDNIRKEIIPYIPLSLPDNEKIISVKEMLHNWLYDNISDVKRNIDNIINQEQLVKGLNIYNITNIPMIMGLAINRFNNAG